jgi:uncharacterized protein (TIGR02266 family)
MDVKRKILIVDDAPMFRELESLFLARSGRVFTAASGQEALALARRERPDVVVADLAMPGMAGDELCRRVKADPDLARTPVIIVTGRDDGDEHAAAVQAGADDVVEKPVDRLSLIQSVNHFLRLAVRGLVRVPMETDVRLSAQSEERWGRSRNISRGGMFIETDAPCPEPETELQLEFSLPETGAALCPTAKVVWRRGDGRSSALGMGLQFLKLDRDAARSLHDFVYERASLDAVVSARSSEPGLAGDRGAVLERVLVVDIGARVEDVARPLDHRDHLIAPPHDRAPTRAQLAGALREHRLDHHRIEARAVDGQLHLRRALAAGAERDLAVARGRRRGRPRHRRPGRVQLPEVLEARRQPIRVGAARRGVLHGVAGVAVDRAARDAPRLSGVARRHVLLVIGEGVGTVLRPPGVDVGCGRSGIEPEDERGHQARQNLRELHPLLHFRTST